MSGSFEKLLLGEHIPMGVGAYLFGEGYPSPMFQNGH